MDVLVLQLVLKYINFDLVGSTIVSYLLIFLLDFLDFLAEFMEVQLFLHIKGFLLLEHLKHSVESLIEIFLGGIVVLPIHCG